MVSKLLQRIARQEALHLAFYASQAARRLESRKTQAFVRRWLGRLWCPVGSGVMPPSETAFLHELLTRDPDGHSRLVRIDQRVDRLPGLQGLALVQKSLGVMAHPLVEETSAA